MNNTLTYGSVCSGIEAATAAWHCLGWRPSFFSEIEAFPRAVLQHHYPKVPLHGDFTTIKAGQYDPIDLLVGGTPCQSFSVAGLRGGLGDARGNLALEYLKLAQRLGPKWLVWENVPGVLSSAGGRDFGSILGGLVELGYGFAYRVLDAQHFGVPQRRRRVFVVGYLGDWRRAAAVLFERDCLSGNPAPRRQAGERAAPTLSASAGGVSGKDAQDGRLVGWPAEIAPCLNAHFGEKMGLENQHIDHGAGLFVSHALRGEGFDASEDGTGRGTPLVPVEPYMLAVRGRGDGHHLEYRQDGTSNAILTPNGGRAGMGVGAIAYNITPSQSNKDYNAREARYAQAVTSGGNRPSARGGDLIAEGRYADAYEADASSLLSTLRKQVGAAAYAEWGLGVLAAFQSPEVLRAWMHGARLRDASQDFKSFVDDRPLSCPEGSPGRTMLKVWDGGPDGSSPQGRGLAKQLAGQPGTALSVLPSERAPSEGEVLNLRGARKGARLLLEALSAFQEVGRPARREAERRVGASAVRRLTPEECEALQGFPRGYTLIQHRGKPAADGPRYKALGNSMAVPVMAWIGQRIAMVDAL